MQSASVKFSVHVTLPFLACTPGQHSKDYENRNSSKEGMQGRHLRGQV